MENSEMPFMENMTPEQKQEFLAEFGSWTPEEQKRFLEKLTEIEDPQRKEPQEETSAPFIWWTIIMVACYTMAIKQHGLFDLRWGSGLFLGFLWYTCLAIGGIFLLLCLAVSWMEFVKMLSNKTKRKPFLASLLLIPLLFVIDFASPIPLDLIYIGILLIYILCSLAKQKI